MFFLLPWNTDAPIYHRPWGTIALIVLNVCVFACQLFDPTVAGRFELHYGDGFTPLQWVTSNFIHGGVIHLLGNMVFLWGFGLVVEGKLGWQRFIPVYLLIGAMECALEQLIFWNSSGTTLGSSSITFGLMAMCLVWAPRNELQVLYVIGFRGGLADLSIVIFAVLHLAMSLVWLAIDLMVWGQSSEWFHFFGAAIGGTLAVLMLKAKLVDCEGWDLFSVLSGNLPERTTKSMSWGFQEDLRRRKLQKKSGKGRRKQSTAEMAAVIDVAKPPRDIADPKRFEQLISNQKCVAAWHELQKIRSVQPVFQPTSQQLLELARGLRKMKEYESSVKVYEELLAKQPDFALGQIELAALLTLSQNRPAAARRCLQTIRPETLPPAQRKMFDDLCSHIQKLLDSGVVELDRR